MHDYFLTPLTLANGGFLSRRSVGFSVSSLGAHRESSAVLIMSPLIRTAIGHVDKSALVMIAGYIRHLMH